MASWSSEVTLAANTTYRIGVSPASATNIRLTYMDVSSNAIFGQEERRSNPHHALARENGALQLPGVPFSVWYFPHWTTEPGAVAELPSFKCWTLKTAQYSGQL